MGHLFVSSQRKAMSRILTATEALFPTKYWCRVIGQSSWNENESSLSLFAFQCFLNKNRDILFVLLLISTDFWKAYLSFLFWHYYLLRCCRWCYCCCCCCCCSCCCGSYFPCWYHYRLLHLPFHSLSTVYSPTPLVFTFVQPMQSINHNNTMFPYVF